MNTSELEYRKPLQWGEIDPYRRGRTHVGMWAWLLQRVSAVFIVFLLVLHLCFTYKPYLQFLLLLAVAFHASLGLRVILLDFNLAKISSARRLVPWTLGLGVAAVDVRDVGDALKYIEAHAERQGDAEKGKVGIRQSAQIFQKPTHVLEIKETAHIAREREDEPGAPLVAVRVLDQPPRGKVDENERDQHEKRARTRAEPIEEQAPQCEHSVAEAGRDNIVYRQKGGQKIKEKR